MARDAEKTFVPADGIIYLGPVGSTAPTDADTTPAAAFIDMGGFARDNLGLQPGREENELRFFGSFFPDKVPVTARTLVISVTMLELTAPTLATAFDGGTVTGGPSEWIYNPPAPRTIRERALIMDLFEGEKTHRWYFPRVKVSDVGQITFQNEDWTPVPLSFQTLNPSTGDPFQVFVTDDGFATTGMSLT